MKYKQMMVILGLSLATVFCNGCSSNESAQTKSDGSAEAQETENVVYGEVVSVEEEKVVIQVGTMREMEKPEEETPDDGEQMEEGEAFSLLDLTEENMEVMITDDTVLQKQGFVGMNGGSPSGGNSTGGEAPGEGGNPPEGEALGEGGNPPEGEAPAEGENPPEGEASAEDGQPEEEASAGDGQPREENATRNEQAEGEAPDDRAHPDGMPEGGQGAQEDGEEISLEDIQAGDTVAVTLDAEGNAEKITVISMEMGGGPMGEMGQPSGGVDSYEAAADYTEDTQVDGETLTSTGTDENAVHVWEGANVIFSNVEISRESSDSTGGDNSSFYGVGAALLTTDGTTYIKDSIINTDAAGGAGIFAYGDGIVYAADTTITTQQNTSGGIHAAGGGTLYAWDVNCETNGTSAAAVRSDRGGGTMVIDGGCYTSNGADSPAVYCTADIAINEAQLTSTGAEAVCIEGLNSLHLYNCDLTGSMPDDERNDCVWNVILYQSMSGDSQVGNSTFEMEGGTLTGENGGMFYTTNTESTITLSNVEIIYPEENDFFLKCTGNQNQRGWGTVGANGADCHFTGIRQEMEGDVIWDTISSLDFYITEESTLKGAVRNDESCVNETGEGFCNLVIDSDSKWIVTGDSTLTELNCAGTIQDEDGNTVTVKGIDGTVYVSGDSKYVITVETYSDSADVEQASRISQWESYQVEKPSELS